MIVVNDGSTDGTAAAPPSFTDTRIRVISQANGGEAVARNRGQDAISGEYVAFLDADDLYLPNVLRAMADYLDVHPEADAPCSPKATSAMKLINPYATPPVRSPPRVV